MRNIAVIILFLLSFNVVAQTSTTNKVVYTTETGSKYHLGSCRYLSKKKIETTQSKAISSGYFACSICKPRGVTSSNGSSKSSSSGRCTATTKLGARCKRKAAAGSNTCWQH